ncbi:hypothetical protein Tco_0660040 [Tanacetum coccineum]
MTVVTNEENELVPTRLVTGWRVCIDYRKLNEATCKDHFPLPFMDQMLERLAGNEFYCFLDGFSGYFQIPIEPKDQEKTTFTSPTELSPTVPLGMLKRCEEHIITKWEMSHFMVKRRHFKEFEVSGHAWILSKIYSKNFQNLLDPLGPTLEKNNALSIFRKIAILAFIILNKELTEGSNSHCSKLGTTFVIHVQLQVIMQLGAVPRTKGLRSIFAQFIYASQTMTEAESTTTTNSEKEMLAVGYASREVSIISNLCFKSVCLPQSLPI